MTDTESPTEDTIKPALILDVATSGFHEVSDKILEVAAILFNPSDLEVLAVQSWVVRHQEAALTKVPAFHAALKAECLESDTSIMAVQGQLLAGDWFDANLIVNRALDFDMRFLKLHLPMVHREVTRPGKLHLELKALEAAAGARGKAPFSNPVPRTMRAPDDAIAAYEEYCHYFRGRAK